ncbi:hypothetical protein PENTCL1PPCAC_22802, partial [Pristionchus entomophagus]
HGNDFVSAGSMDGSFKDGKSTGDRRGPMTTVDYLYPFSWENLPDFMDRGSGSHLTMQKLHTTRIKDSGRDAFYQVLHEFNQAAEAFGLLGFDAPRSTDTPSPSSRTPPVRGPTS